MRKLIVGVVVITLIALLVIYRPWVPKVTADTLSLRHPAAGDVVGFADKHGTSPGSACRSRRRRSAICAGARRGRIALARCALRRWR
jgi:hypothetical protein